MLKCAGNEDAITMKADDAGDVVTFMFESPGTCETDDARDRCVKTRSATQKLERLTRGDSRDAQVKRRFLILSSSSWTLTASTWVFRRPSTR